MRAIAARIRLARTGSVAGSSESNKERVAGSGGQIRRELLQRAEREVGLLLLLQN